jgi:hypothetical protein
MRQYRHRLSQLQADLEADAEMQEPERRSRARVERDWLLSEIESATGLAGRPRHFSDDVERARIAVGKAVRRALERLTTADPILGEQLRARVRTGTRCCFDPR